MHNRFTVITLLLPFPYCLNASKAEVYLCFHLVIGFSFMAMHMHVLYLGGLPVNSMDWLTSTKVYDFLFSLQPPIVGIHTKMLASGFCFLYFDQHACANQFLHTHAEQLKWNGENLQLNYHHRQWGYPQNEFVFHPNHNKLDQSVSSSSTWSKPTVPSAKPNASDKSDVTNDTVHEDSAVLNVTDKSDVTNDTVHEDSAFLGTSVRNSKHELIESILNNMQELQAHCQSEHNSILNSMHELQVHYKEEQKRILNNMHELQRHCKAEQESILNSIHELQAMSTEIPEQFHALCVIQQAMSTVPGLIIQA